MASSSVLAQQGQAGKQIKKTDVPIELDGVLEEAWLKADSLSGFSMYFPVDSGKPDYQTVVRLLSDQVFLYVSAVCYFQKGQEPFVSSLNRDFSSNRNDHFIVYLDPYGKANNGFKFGVNAKNAQMEGVIFQASLNDESWDNKWFSETRVYEDRWVAEMAIPYSTLRYTEGLGKWRFNFSRNNINDLQLSTWVDMKQVFSLNNLAFMRALDWVSPPPKPGRNISLIPYVATRTQRDFLAGEETAKTQPQIGGDAKIGLTSSLNLDLTVNPDFSQVDVDQQIINLSRFNVRFPERRQFFLENQDLFNNYGFTRIRPFFSRQIGIARDENGVTRQIPMLYGARLSGKLGDKWRIGLLNAQTNNFSYGIEETVLEVDSSHGTPDTNTVNRERAAQLRGNNFTVFTLQRNVFKRSALSFVMVNRTALDSTEHQASLQYNPMDFNRLLGADFNLITKGDRFRGKAYVHHTFTSGLPEEDAYSHASWLSYNSRKLNLAWNHEYVGKHYNPEVGFLQRPFQYWRLEPWASYYQYPEHELIARIQHRGYNSTYFTGSGQLTDFEASYSLNVDFSNRARLSFQPSYVYVKLRNNFDPSRGKNPNRPLLEGTDYGYWGANLSWRTDYNKPVSIDGMLGYGGFFNGRIFKLYNTAVFLARPYGSLSLVTRYDRIMLPEGYNSAEYLLLGPSLRLSLRTNLFFTQTVQYNQQAQKFSVFSRLQWRFAPVSDLFIVFYDQHQADQNFIGQPHWLQTGRTEFYQLVVKLNYWFNL